MQVEVWTNLPDVDTTRIRRLRRSEYDRLVDLGVFEGERVELIRGVIVRMPPPGAPHAAPIEILNELLVPALLGRARVRVQLPLIAPDDSEPEPDLAVVARADHHVEHPSAALLIIEVARSSLAYDRGTKAPLYAAMGVPELWIVDVEGRRIEVMRSPRGDLFESTSTAGIGDSIALAAFPDVEIQVASLFP